MFKFLFFVFILYFSLSFNGYGQNRIQSKQYPQNYFRYPLDLPPSTAGSFGELRPNHFHAGLDFKTDHHTGYPVYAVFDGYVSELRVQLGGYGNSIYITHPNGYTSVYGHIEKFSDAMLKVVRANQSRLQSFEVDVKLPPGQIRVCKGDMIALSGNAGASEGPHLHFEIRDTRTEETINPQLFGLTVPDHKAPKITAIGIYRLDGKPFSEKTPKHFWPVQGKAGNFHLLKQGTINLSGEVGFGISTNDMNSVSTNHTGVYSIELKLDRKTVYTFAAERFAFDQTHGINAYIDYPELLQKHRWVQKCFIPPGSKISLYRQSVNRGVINFRDNAFHKVEYVVKDFAGNTSTVSITVKSRKPEKRYPPVKPDGIRFRYNQKNKFSDQKVKLLIMPGNLYDDVDFTYAVLPKKRGAFSATYHIHNAFTPIRDGFDLWIKPDKVIGKYIKKAVIINTAGICGITNYEGGYLKTKAPTFGDYFIRVDTVPPVILPLNIKNGGKLSSAKGIFVKITDNMSGVKTYRGKIDGKWVLMELDYKSKILSYTFNADVLPGKHKFELTATDNTGNSTTFAANFYR